MNTLSSIFVLAAASILPSSLAYAQMGAAAHADIIVNGSRLDQTLREIGTSVSVITADDINRLGVSLAVEAIAAAPGVTINQNGGFGGAAAVRIRGAGSEQTLVLIDGVVVNDPSTPGGGYDFARLDVADIERIEILRGPQSTLWGTDAIGGVVSIITRPAQDGLHIVGFGEYGSYQTMRGGAALTGGNAMGDFRLAANATDAEGISKADSRFGNGERDGFDSVNLSARGGVNLPADARLDVTLLWSDANTAFDSFAFGAPGNVADGDDSSATRSFSATGALRLPLFDGQLENDLQLGYADIRRENFSAGQPSFDALGKRLNLRYQGTLKTSNWSMLAFGAEREESKADDNDTAINGLFGLAEIKPFKTLTLTGGLRIDDHQRFGSKTTARLAAALELTDALALRGSWGQGFKAPTIFQTTFFCCGATSPNADLAAETSEAFDLGFTLSSPDQRASLSVTYFDQDIRNLITFSFGIGSYENIARVNSNGVEVEAQLQVTDWMQFDLAYAWINAKEADGTRLDRQPRHSGDLRLTFDNGGPLSGALLVRHNGRETDSSGPVEAWTRVDATARYALTRHVELYARIENLLDTRYQQVLGYGTPGLSGLVGLRLKQ